MTRRLLCYLGVACILAGIGTAAVLGWQLYGTGLLTEQAQSRLRATVRTEWAAQRAHPALIRPAGRPAPASKPPPNGAVAILRIPRLGAGWEQVVVEGTSPAALRQGPGHLIGSALPGQVGNFVVSGHRTTYGAPFGNLDRLRPGDAIEVEIAAGSYRYTVTGSRVVSPQDLAVTWPVPGVPGGRPTRAVLTFTTCHPRFSAAQRLIVQARLSGFTPFRAAG